mmetsp:Transcript_6130/g.15577  ORF Transcript_6130/g.15577 Transcript_6130/m.15577 type:complete len:191 (+) Transcript_6130:116-688(+)
MKGAVSRGTVAGGAKSGAKASMSATRQVRARASLNPRGIPGLASRSHGGDLRRESRNQVEAWGRQVGPSRAVTQDAPVFESGRAEEENVVPPAGFSGLMGKALKTPKRYPTRPEVFAAIPKELYKKDTLKSLCYAFFFDFAHPCAWSHSLCVPPYEARFRSSVGTVRCRDGNCGDGLLGGCARMRPRGLL